MDSQRIIGRGRERVKDLGVERRKSRVHDYGQCSFLFKRDLVSSHKNKERPFQPLHDNKSNMTDTSEFLPSSDDECDDKTYHQVWVEII